MNLTAHTRHSPGNRDVAWFPSRWLRRLLPLARAAFARSAAHPALLGTESALRPAAGAASRAGTSRASAAARASAKSSGTAVFTAVIVVVVACGWLLRHRTPLTPESGLGYALGVAGGATILLLLSYSARKRLRFLGGWGLLSDVFHVHMVLGVFGPVLILFHCNFRLGAPNSNVALFSMLVVATSGVVGRYVYTRVSHGLYGARATFDELHQQLVGSAHALQEQLPPASRALQRLTSFSAHARASDPRMGVRLYRLAALPLLAVWVRRGALADLRGDFDDVAERQRWDARERVAHEDAIRAMIRGYIALVVKEAQFSAYERLFALWHALHVPLFVMLLLAGALHVVAVHMY
jgi:hypothetical protein